MSRGKHAASQNAKKLVVAEERIVELEREIALIVQAAHVQEQKLLTEIQALRNRFVSDVESLAADKVHAVKVEAEMRVEKARKLQRESVVAAFHYVHANGEVRLSLKDWGAVAGMLDVDPGQLVTAGDRTKGYNRIARRASRADVNAILESMGSPNTGLVRRGR